MLAELLSQGRVWQGRDAAIAGQPTIATGFAELDVLLPGGGWPTQGLIELLLDQPGAGELSLLLPAVQALMQELSGWLLWISPPFIPYAPGLLQAGIAVEQVLVVGQGDAKGALWAAEQGLKSGACAAVLLYQELLSASQTRRLQLAQAAARQLLFVVRPVHCLSQPSPASLRLQLQPDDDGVFVRVCKCRGRVQDRPLRLPLVPVHRQAQ